LRAEVGLAAESSSAISRFRERESERLLLLFLSRRRCVDGEGECFDADWKCGGSAALPGFGSWRPTRSRRSALGDGETLSRLRPRPGERPRRSLLLSSSLFCLSTLGDGDPAIWHSQGARSTGICRNSGKW